jgi:hypothetical protein
LIAGLVATPVAAQARPLGEAMCGFSERAIWEQASIEYDMIEVLKKHGIYDGIKTTRFADCVAAIGSMIGTITENIGGDMGVPVFIIDATECRLGKRIPGWKS